MRAFSWVNLQLSKWYEVDSLHVNPMVIQEYNELRVR